jgi:hypothetical protein
MDEGKKKKLEEAVQAAAAAKGGRGAAPAAAVAPAAAPARPALAAARGGGGSAAQRSSVGGREEGASLEWAACVWVHAWAGAVLAQASPPTRIRLAPCAPPGRRLSLVQPARGWRRPRAARARRGARAPRGRRPRVVRGAAPGGAPGAGLGRRRRQRRRRAGGRGVAQRGGVHKGAGRGDTDGALQRGHDCRAQRRALEGEGRTGLGTAPHACPAAAEKACRAARRQLWTRACRHLSIPLINAATRARPKPLFQTRLEAMEAVVAKAQEPGAGGAAQQLVQALAQVPGWDEKNFQVRGFTCRGRAAAGWWSAPHMCAFGKSPRDMDPSLIPRARPPAPHAPGVCQGVRGHPRCRGRARVLEARGVHGGVRRDRQDGRHEAQGGGCVGGGR